MNPPLPLNAPRVAQPKRDIRILDWRSLEKNTLRGFFSAQLPSGLIIHEMMLHEKGESQWIAFPAKEWINPAGEKKYTCLLEFASRERADQFKHAVLAALQRFFEETR
jgi:hypothetical protein